MRLPNSSRNVHSRTSKWHQSGIGGGGSEIALAVGVAAGRAQDVPRTVVALDRDGHEASRAERARGGPEELVQLAEVEKDVRRDDRVVRRGLRAHGADELRLTKLVVGPGCTRLLEHARRQVDPDEPPGQRAKQRAAQPGAAARIQHREIRCPRRG